MSKKDEALDLALEKINKAREKVAALCDGKERWTMSVPVRPDYDHDVVISGALSVAEDAIKQALAQPGQEPVAQWQLRHHLHTDGIWENCTESEAAVMQKQAQTFEIRPLYTTPPAQPAVPLTDEQIEKKFKSRFGEDSWRVIGAFYYEGHRDGEAAHGITGKGQNGPATLNQLEGKP